MAHDDLLRASPGILWLTDDDLRHRLAVEQDDYDRQMATIRAEADECLLDLGERLRQGVHSCAKPTQPTE